MSELFPNVTANADGTISDPAIDAAYATRPDAYNAFCRAKHGVPEGWLWFQLSSSPEDAPKGMAKIQGAVYQAGKRGARHRVKGTEQTLFINMEELRTFDRERAVALDKCWNCWGTGYRLAGSISNTRYYRKCRECDGTGKPSASAPASDARGVEA